MSEIGAKAELLAEIERLRSENAALRGRVVGAEVDAFLRGLLDDVKGISVQGYGADGIVRYWNKASEELYGYSAEEALGNELVELIIPEPMRAAVRDLIAQAAVSGSMPPPEELSLQHKDGSLVPVLSSHSVIMLDGAPPMLFCIDVDLAPLKRAEQNLRRSLAEKELLLCEVHHRVKNNLQVILSLLDMSGRRARSEEAQALCRDLGAKIISMSMVHSQLYQNDRLSDIDMAGHIRHLWNYLKESFCTSSVEDAMDLQELHLPVNLALPLGMVVGELAKNIFNHAFPVAGKGRVEISLRGDTEMVWFTIRDDGIGLACDGDEPTGKLGLKLVRSIVSYQLRGKISFENDGGTAVVVCFPRSVSPTSACVPSTAPSEQV